MARHETQVEKDEGHRSFSVFLGKLNDGEFETELSRKLHELGLALDERLESADGASGAIAINLKFTADRRIVTVRADVKVKLPETKRPSTALWLTPGSNFSPENPRQAKLPLREATTKAVVDVTPEEPTKVKEA